MTHASPTALALALLALACGPRAVSSPDVSATAEPDAPAPPASTSSAETPVPHETRPDLDVPDHEVVIVDLQDGGPPHGELRQGDQVWTGRVAFLRALGGIGRDDAEQVAILASIFVDPAGAAQRPWSGGGVMGDATPEPATINGDTLVYWRDHPNRPVMSRVTVLLGSGAASVSVPDDERQPLGAVEAVAELEAALATDESARIGAAISAVAEASEAGATEALLQVVKTESRTPIRRIVVDAVGRSRPPGGEAVLVAALSSDADKEVRRRAVRALDNWPSPEGVREALQTASTDDSDAVVKAIAKRALGKLGG